MTSQILREKFVEYFRKRKHRIFPPASLIADDTSTLFTSAGMQQFKHYYLFPGEIPSSRTATIQPCFRTSDIDEVGDDDHLTFFEMMGNFSFGYPEKENSYFKKEAIFYAWDFLNKVLKIDKNRISATYFEGEYNIPEDSESKNILNNIKGLRGVIAQGFKENFWSLGQENSPGGPTVEFYVDGIEIWNLVFNEYVYKNKEYTPSNYKGVDTGMGLERLSAVLNNKTTVFDIDLYVSIIAKLEEISKQKYKKNTKEFRIIADHIKAAIVAINEGALPSNVGQGYVIRRLIRRSIVKGFQIKINKNFACKLAEVVFRIYDDVCAFKVKKILTELEKEESKFRKTLKSGLKLIRSKKEINGQDLFDLYQSFGIPLEISKEEAKLANIPVDQDAANEFKKLLKGHQELSRVSTQGMFKGGLSSFGQMETKYHTATHLLNQSLRDVLGYGVRQQGSNITSERLRFDFTYPMKLTEEQIKQVENLVNEQIRRDLPVIVEEMSPEKAKQNGALGFFDQKYGDKVKVYSVGDFSKEICGGPHVQNTSDLGTFRIIKEESSSSGIRRIKAILE